MNDENKSSANSNVNQSAAEPRFKTGDIVWSPVVIESEGLMVMQCKILGVVYARRENASTLEGYRLVDNDNCTIRKPECVFATKEECERCVDEIKARTKKRK